MLDQEPRRQPGRPARAGERMVAFNMSLPANVLDVLEAELGDRDLRGRAGLVRAAIFQYLMEGAPQRKTAEDTRRRADAALSLALTTQSAEETPEGLEERKEFFRSIIEKEMKGLSRSD